MAIVNLKIKVFNLVWDSVGVNRGINTLYKVMCKKTLL